jgi:putative ABC transport system permease protein
VRSLPRDLLEACRGLRRERIVASTVVVTLGAAIGASGLGVFAVLSRSVSVRRQELGLRMAIGARVDQIIRLVVGRAFRWSLVGIAIGTALAWPAAGLLTSLLFEVEPTDPAVFASVALFVLLAGVLASWFPARRAAATDPSEALRPTGVD